MAATDIFGTPGDLAKAYLSRRAALEQKTLAVSEVALEQDKATPSKRAALKQKTLDASEVALEQAKATLDASEVALDQAEAYVSKRAALKHNTLDASEVALEQVKATPSKRAALRQKPLAVSEVAVAKPTESASKHTPSKRTLSAQSSPRRSTRHRGSPKTKKERSLPDSDTGRGQKRGLSPDSSLVASQKDESTPSKKHSSWTGSSRGHHDHTGSPSALKQRIVDDLLDSLPEAMSERGTVEKKETRRGTAKKVRGRSKKPASMSPANSSSSKSRSKEAKPKARSRSRADTKSAPSGKPPDGVEIIDLT
jgi:hypothetical protein